MAFIPKKRRSLLSSPARIQTPWIKVQIGRYIFGVFSRRDRTLMNNGGQFYSGYDVQYPNYIQGLSIIKINGQVNQYTLKISYPITDKDDPNFFEKVFSSVSKTRKITFSYGDMSTPSYIYKDEEAIITNVQQSFALESSRIDYTVSAVSGSALAKAGNFTFIFSQPRKPSDVIKEIFKNNSYGLRNLFTGMSDANIDQLIASDDKAVQLDPKTNIGLIDYITYLVSCMIPSSTTTRSVSDNIYILTIHDDTGAYDSLYDDYDDRTSIDKGKDKLSGPYFKVTKTSYLTEQSDAYEVDIGFNTATIVKSFQIENNENYSMLYDYSGEQYPESYVRRIDENGKWVEIYSPTTTSKNDTFETRAQDRVWWTKITKYPINASIVINGLLRPAELMTFLRLNVIFPGGHKHISSGLYIITGQQDEISGSGYQTTLKLTKISGDNVSQTHL